MKKMYRIMGKDYPIKGMTKVDIEGKKTKEILCTYTAREVTRAYTT